jgi:hypothetical protein
LKLTDFEFIELISNYIFFIPVYGLLFILNLFIMFLYPGFKKLGDDTNLYFIIANCIFINIITNAIALKIVFSDYLLFSNYMSWTVLLGLVGLAVLVDYYYIVSDDKTNVGDIAGNSSKDYSISSVFNILLTLSLGSFIFMIGLGLDYNWFENYFRRISIYALLWIFLICFSLKCYFKNKKIDNYFEWKKMNII